MNEFAALIEMRRRRQAQFGAYGSWLSSAVDAVASVGRSVDPTSSSSIFGRGVARVAAPVAHAARDYVVRPAVALSAATITGGISTLAAERIGGGTRATFGLRPTAIGVAEAAIVGTGVAAAIYAPAAVAAAGGKVLATSGAVAASAGTAAVLHATGITPTPSVPSTAQPSSSTPVGTLPAAGDGATSNRAAVLAGLGLGFVAGGPVGAVVGGVAGAIIAARRQS